MIYIHIPFCRSFCTYCGFYSESVAGCRQGADERLFGKFADALCSEIASRSGEITGGIQTLYIGGGTPSVLPLSVFSAILEALSRAGHGGPFDEFTVEVNPEDVLAGGMPYLHGLLALGVNRISMGVQSFDDAMLRRMNRRNDAAGARAAYRLLRRAGFGNIGIDLIFGIGSFCGARGKDAFSEALWRSTLEQALDIGGDGTVPRHISAYQLSVEQDSALEQMIDKGLYSEASEEACERDYRILCETLAGAGYRHYEISNFAVPGYEAKHNSAYWNHTPYTGFGPGAHSFAPEGGGKPAVRSAVRPDLGAYLKAAADGDWSGVVTRESLSPQQIRMEDIMLGLRTDKGIERSLLASDACLDALVPAESGRLRIPEEKFFVSDNIIAALV